MELLWITKAKYLDDYKIYLLFNNGKEKTVDLKNHLYGEIFEPLKNIDIFKNFVLSDWTIEWKNGADFAPEFLYEIGN